MVITAAGTLGAYKNLQVRELASSSPEHFHALNFSSQTVVQRFLPDFTKVLEERVARQLTTPPTPTHGPFS